MKIRTDFVTNSSSSSFILAFKDENDIENFKENCESYEYQDFLRIIENLACDFLEISNDSKEIRPIRPLIEKIRKDIYWGRIASYQLQKLYDDDYKMSSWETIYIKINDLNDKEIDFDELKFEDIEEEDKYTISIIDNKSRRNKEEAIDTLRNNYAGKYIYELLNEKINRDNYKNSDDYYNARENYRQSEECRSIIDNYLKNTDFIEKKEQIENAKLIVSGMIWDTSGGLIEWAIRNGFIEDNFRNNCVICYNVG